MCGCAQWRSHSKTTKRKAQPFNPSHPRSQPSQTIAEGSKTLVAALRKSVSGRQRPICPMVKEAVRDLDAAKLAECSGRLAPGWLASAKDWSANKAKNSQRRRAGSSRSWRSECLRRLRPWRRVRQRWLPWRRSVEQAKQREASASVVAWLPAPDSLVAELHRMATVTTALEEGNSASCGMDQCGG